MSETRDTAFTTTELRALLGSHSGPWDRFTPAEIEGVMRSLPGLLRIAELAEPFTYEQGDGREPVEHVHKAKLALTEAFADFDG